MQCILSHLQRECTVQVEVKGGGGLLCNIAAMLLKVLQIQSSFGERGIYQCGNLLQTQWHATVRYNFQTTWLKKFHMIQVNMFPSLIPRSHRRGESPGDIWPIPLASLGRIFPSSNHIAETPFVVATLETLGHFSTMTAIFWHWKKKQKN